MLARWKARPVGDIPCKLRLSLLVVIIIFSLDACASKHLVLTNPAPVAAGDQYGTRYSATAPFRFPVLSTQQQSLLFNAYQVAFGKCVQVRGFRYWPEPEPRPTLSQLFPYVINNVSWARSHGFGNPDGSNSDAATKTNQRDPNLNYYDSLTPSKRAALVRAENAGGPNDPGIIARLPTGQVIGFSKYSCYASAGNALYGTRYNWYQAEMTYYALPSLWQEKVEASPEFGRALKAWAACMQHKGEFYATPSAAAKAFIFPVKHISSSESRNAFRAAVSEALCANSTNFTAIARDLDAKYKVSVVGRYQKSIKLFQQLVTAALPRAKELMRSE